MVVKNHVVNLVRCQGHARLRKFHPALVYILQTNQITTFDLDINIS